jgi:hypothetical protein
MTQTLGFLALLGLLGFAAYAYEKAKADYDPEAICAKQTDVSKDQCLAAVDLAMSAGW